MIARPKILHIVVAGQIGGAERLLVEIATRPEVSGADHAVALMTPNRDLAAFFRDHGVTVHDRGDVHENPLAYLWRSYGPYDIAWLAKDIAAEHADILHCHTYGSHVLAVRTAMRCGLPLLRTEHGVRHYRDPTCSLNRHWALRHTTRIAAVSDFVGRTVAAIAPEAAAKLTVVRNGIPIERFEPQPPRREGPFTLAAIGRLEPVKRLEIAIAALARVPGIHLDIVGDGAERQKLEGLVREAHLTDRVRFLGHLGDPRPLIAACDAVINCTAQEGMPLAILEAGAMQRPAIAFAGGGMVEAVVDGRTGWLAEADGTAAFTAVLQQAGADRAEVMRRGVEARAWVTAHFGLNEMCEAYGAVYRSLVSGAKNGRGS